MTAPKALGAKPVVDYRAPLPASTTRRLLPPTGRAGTSPQTLDLTANTPTVDDRNANWSKDERSIVFQSNRQDLPGTTAGPSYHVYQMNAADGSGVTAVTGPLAANGVGTAGQQTEPALNPTSSAVVYIQTDPTGAVDLHEYNFATTVDRSILRNNPQNFTFVSVNHPEYGIAVGGNVGVIFSGKRNIDTSNHIFTVDTQSGNVAQVTTGPFDDRDPTLSPDPNKPVIAFDRAPATGGKRDIYVQGTNPNIQNATRVTNFSVGGVAADNVEPAWSTNKTDPGGNIPAGQLLAFATTREDTNNDGNANAINGNGSHDIYYLRVTVAPDPSNPSVFTVTNPEPGNGALKLVTSDKNHIYDDRHPTWPQFINTYRVAYNSDRTKYDPVADANGGDPSGPAGQPNDIFASALIDIDAPTLFRYDTVTGDVARIDFGVDNNGNGGTQTRLGQPGQNVKITVKLADFQSGIRDVWAQIKNPNSKYQSADGLEHKVYITDLGGSADGTNISPVPHEFEMQRISAADNSYANPRYIASISDIAAYSGGTHRPDAGWLQLNFVSRDATTGQATYAGVWKTNVFPSDYVVDIIAYDNAINPFVPGQTNNWVIYDNVWGFTTAGFNPAHGILFVSDYSAGQKFFNSRFSNHLLTNVFNTFWGTEQWMTDIDMTLWPTTIMGKTATTSNTLVNVMNTLGVNSYGSFTDEDATGATINYDPLTDDGTVSSDGFSVPNTQQYDMWRILCRGPLPDSVLQQYLPRSIQQPPDTVDGEKTPRTVISAPRCVIWNAPYSGDLFVGQGSITDPNVQNQLHNYLAAGGRLVINGQDIGWALTLDGTAQNPFFTNDLKATYVNDAIPGSVTNLVTAGGIPFIIQCNSIFGMAAAGAPNPVSYDPWRDLTNKAVTIDPGHRYGGPPYPEGWNDYLSTATEWLIGGPTPQNYRDWGSLGVYFSDEVTPIAPAVADLTYTNGNASVLHAQDPSNNSRVVYMPCGIEGLNPDVWTLPSPPWPQNFYGLRNRRPELIHNAVCWLRTGTITGTVVTTDAGTPIANALVRIYSTFDAKGNPLIAYTALTRQDGSYQIDGVEPEEYVFTAVKPGYTIQHRTYIQVHGGFRSQISVKMTTAPNAIIKGQVTRTDGKTPIVGATVTATDNVDATAPVQRATTDANGNYVLDNVPSGTTYTLTVTDPQFAQPPIPANYQVPNPNDPIQSQRDTLVQPNKTYVGFNFELKAIPGSVTGHVFASDANGNKLGPIAGALVTATDNGTQLTATTDANGAYSFSTTNNPPNGLDPGLAQLVASAPGFAPNSPISVTVVTQQNTVAPDIVLAPVPPGTVSGLVTRTSDNAAISGVLIQLKDVNGNVVASTTTTTSTTTNGYTYNYKLTGVPAGVTYTAYATKSGYTSSPTSQPVPVVSGQETQNINFSMSPLFTFSSTLSLVSAPYDYSSLGGSVADLLGVSPTDPSFLFATWNAGQYVFFPTPPADQFHLGRGYFLAYKTNLALTTQGTPAPTNQPYSITLNNGWNLIGDPFPFAMDWTKVTIIDGGTALTYDAAVTAGDIAPALYSYQAGSYVLDFQIQPWVGYWVRAYKPLTLQLDPVNGQYGRAERLAPATTRSAALQGGNGWTLNLAATVGSAHDNATMLGVATRATTGFDGFKSPKPPVFGKNYAYVTFDHADWGSHSGSYGMDLRPATALSNSWNVTVQTDQPNAPASLSWPNAATIGRAVTLQITDLSNGNVRFLNNSSSYTWTTGPHAESRQFRIDAVRSTANNRLVISALLATVGRGTTAGISYNLSVPANVQIRVLRQTGDVVRSFNAQASRAAGTNEATWDLRTDRGMPVPTGVYLIEVKATSIDGSSSARQVTPILITR